MLDLAKTQMVRYGTVTPTPGTEHRALHTRHTLYRVQYTSLCWDHSA